MHYHKFSHSFSVHLNEIQTIEILICINLYLLTIRHNGIHQLTQAVVNLNQTLRLNIHNTISWIGEKHTTFLLIIRNIRIALMHFYAQRLKGINNGLQIIDIKARMTSVKHDFSIGGNQKIMR